MTITDAELIEKAKTAAEMAYAPYSSFTVGAALVGKSGRIYTGCNIESASYGATNCAERTAFFKALSEGEKEFEKIAIVGGKKLDFADFCTPCGICRQVMSEFCGKDFVVLLGRNDGQIKKTVLGELLPMSFNL